MGAPETGFTADLGWLRLRHLSRSQARDHHDPCQGVDAVILPEAGPSGCLVITAHMLRDSGALALWPGQDSRVRVVSAAALAGQRYWSAPQLYQNRHGPQGVLRHWHLARSGAVPGDQYVRINPTSLP